MSFLRFIIFFIAICSTFMIPLQATAELHEGLTCLPDNRHLVRRINVMMEMIERAHVSTVDNIHCEVYWSLTVQLATEFETLKSDIANDILSWERSIERYWKLIETASTADEIRELLYQIEQIKGMIERHQYYVNDINTLEDKYCPWILEVTDR